MKIEKLLNSVHGFQMLTGQELPIKIAYRLMKMIGRVNEELGFFNSRQKQIADAEDPKEDKEKQLRELLNFDAEWDLEPIRIPLTDKLRLSCSDMMALEGLVEFYEEEDHERDHDQCAK